MSRRVARRLAVALGALYGVLLVVSLVLAIVGRMDGEESGGVIALVGFAAVGSLIAARRPENAVGWILLAVAFLIGGQSAASAYFLALDDPASAWGVEIAASAQGWALALSLGLVGVFLPLLFPTGRPPSPRWRLVAWAGALAIALSGLAAAVEPGPFGSELTDAPNPLGVGGRPGEAVAIAGHVGTVLLFASLAAAAISIVVRFRRARGVERQQLKWLALALAVMATGLATAALAEVLDPVESVRDVSNAVGSVGWTTFLASLALGIPIAAAVSILRYRLFDIDVVINRTLVYGALTAVLAGTYVGLVILFQLVLGPLTQGNELAVAVSTLAVAALFRPARRRVQETVDRRFYRRKYDAERTLAAFSARLRDEVDLETLAADLAGVVRETVEPAHVSLWLREAAR